MKVEAKKRMDLILWVISTFFIFATLLLHSPWRDEGQAIMLAQDATGFWDLIQRIRWEGHPMLWFLIAKAAGPSITPLIHGLIAVLTNAIIVFKSKWPAWMRWTLPLSFYFVFEYAVISRDYAIGVLLLFTAVSLWKGKHRNRMNGAFILLLLATQANFFSALLAGVLGLLMLLENPKDKNWYWRIPLALFVLIFTAYQLTPPETGGFASERSFDFDKLQHATQMFTGGTPLPVYLTPSTPAISILFFTNGISLLVALGLLSFMTLTLRKVSHQMAFAIVSFVILLFCSMVLVGFARHLGHIWIFYLLLLFVESREGIEIRPTILLKLLVAGQLVGGLTHLVFEYITPYSESRGMADYLENKNIPAQRTAVFPAAYGAGISLLSGEAYYQPDMDTSMTHIIWNPDSQADYYPKDVLRRLFERYQEGEVYLITPINMTYENARSINPWKPILQPEEINTHSESGFAESFHLYKIQLDSLSKP
ncbi:hypothetical protein [Phaeocystidibacter marisrubri]|uniref:Glycosyltransferase RgtA/B/C/D-like domain-containing protein n=1 Tax=Phaeocystidibacter marisrubri TaxID=1577780 RepID=A0A6L3ZE62_9FLAO|nr:hypothetical protein [Phaeocystidibacter marisrubri]KAB2815960.1 hypothetical protein F8C82_09695 [Phaeocystidibacter marisrubri]GGH66601.1 hypothetical protein GCM10011318_04740 [Phaeocystidibacter marisrubri]